MLSWDLNISTEINKCIFIVDRSKVKLDENPCLGAYETPTFNYKVYFKDFYSKLCVCSHHKRYKTNKTGFHSIAWVMTQGWDFGVLGVPRGWGIIFFRTRSCSHGPGGVTMHPLRTLWDWLNIVHWTPLIKNQDVNTRYLGSYPPFWMVFKMAAMKKEQNAYKV